MRNSQINKKSLVKTKVLLYLFMLVFVFSYTTQSLSSQGVNVTGAPDSLVPITESEGTATAKAQEIAFEYLSCFLGKSSDIKNPATVFSEDLVECIQRTNNNLNLSFSQEFSELIISETSISCNNSAVFAQVSLITTPQTNEEEDDTDEEEDGPPVLNTKEQRKRDAKEVSVDDIIQQINSLVSNPLYETGYQKLHLCMAQAVDSIGFVILANSRSPEQRETDGNRNSSTGLFGEGDEGSEEGEGDAGSSSVFKDLRRFGFGIYNEKGNNYDVIIQKGDEECVNYFSIAGTVSQEIEDFCKENIINTTAGGLLPNLSADTNKITNDLATDIVQGENTVEIFSGFDFKAEEGLDQNEVISNLRASIISGIAFCAGVEGVTYLFDLAGFTSVASSDAQNKIYPCIINPLTEAVREQIINKIFQEYINYANSGFDGDTLRFDNLGDFTTAALDDTANAYFSNVANDIFGGCGISFPGLYLYLTTPSVDVARITCSPFKFIENTSREYEKTVEQWEDQLANPGKYSLGIQIDLLEQAKQAAVESTTSFIEKSEDSNRIPKAKDKDCIKDLIRKRNNQIDQQSLTITNPDEGRAQFIGAQDIDANRRAEVEAIYRKADQKTFGSTDGSVVSTAEAFNKCGISTNPDELKKLEETAETASFTELISKDELRDLLGKAVGATLVGALRKYIRAQEGEEPDSSSEGDPYSYVSQDPSQRILEAYNSSLKALWQQNLGAREFSTLIQLFELQENAARMFQSYFVTLDNRACIIPGLYEDGLADPADRKILGYETKQVETTLRCYSSGDYLSGHPCYGKPNGSTVTTTQTVEDRSKPIFGDEPTTSVQNQASSYIFRDEIDGKYFDQLDRWCLENTVVTKNISKRNGFRGSNKINFENKSNTLRLLINSVGGDFDISTDGVVGQIAHRTKENHNKISTAFSSLLSLNTDSILSDSEKDDQSKELVYQISEATANLVLLLKEGSLSTINQVLDDTFDVLKHQRTAAQQFGASIEFREWLKNKDGVNKTRLFIKEDSLYGTDRNERFFAGEDLFREGSGIVDNTFKTGENIDLFDDYSDDRDFCNFYPDSSIDVDEISLFTGQTIGTRKYIPTDCAAGHLSNLIKKGDLDNDIENFNTYMINAVPRLFAVYTDAMLNSYTYKSQFDSVREKGEFPSNGRSDGYGRYYTEDAYHRDHAYILKQFVEESRLLGISIEGDTKKSVFTQKKLNSVQKALQNKVNDITLTSVLDSI